MRRILFLLIPVLLFGSCENEVGEKSQIIFLRSYIYTYEAGPAELFYISPFLTEKGFLLLRFGLGDKSIRYDSPETGGENSDKFLEIAERNSDRSYNWKEYFSPESDRCCCADNFKAMQVVCLNAAWDDVHPAGASLNDLMTIKYISYYEFIRSSYTIFRNTPPKLLTQLAEDDLTMIDPYIKLYFSNPPAAPGSYEMQVTMVTTENEEKIAACELIWE